MVPEFRIPSFLVDRICLFASSLSSEREQKLLMWAVGWCPHAGDITPRSPVKVSRRFGGTNCLHVQDIITSSCPTRPLVRWRVRNRIIQCSCCCYVACVGPIPACRIPQIRVYRALCINSGLNKFPTRIWLLYHPSKITHIELILWECMPAE